MTNADVIRSMTDKQLDEFLAQFEVGTKAVIQNDKGRGKSVTVNGLLLQTNTK